MISSNKQSKDELLPLITSCKHFSSSSFYNQLTELNLSNLQLNKIDTFPFEHFPKLQSLDLSHNKLISIHSNWLKSSENTLTYLNISHNNLETLLFLKDLKYLKTLNVTQNLLQNNERFLSLYICPTLEHLIDFNQEQIHYDQMKLNQLYSLVYSIKSKENHRIYQDFHQLMIENIEKEKIFSGFAFSPLGNDFIENIFKSKQNLKTFLSDDFHLSMNIKEKPKEFFVPIKCLRAHHQSAKDLTTISVHMCAFEPNTLDHILATCGGQKVCFIDCKTCEITHLYEVAALVSTNRKKNKTNNIEYFSCLCWIKIEDLKILAVGATNGFIYLLAPKWKLMFGLIELPASSISCLTWHSNNPFILAIGSYHTVRLINIRSYIDRLQSFIRKQNKPTVQFDYVDSSVFINKVCTTHIYNLYDGYGPLIIITDLLFYPLSKGNTLLLVSTTSGLFVIKYQVKQDQLPIQLPFPKLIWTVSEHIESLRLIDHSTHLFAMNILNLDQIYCFDLEKSLQNQQLHIILTLPNPSRQIPTKIAICSNNNTSFECIIGSNHGSFYYHQIQLYQTKELTSPDEPTKILWTQFQDSIFPNILSACLNEQYLCLTTNNNLICIYKR